MCGFAGIINNEFPVHEKQISEIGMQSSFRGPDSHHACVYSPEWQKQVSGNHALFFNRLSILDLDSRSDQPFEDEDSILVFNGEIYNYLDLKKNLLAEGCVFRTTSDTEVLFYALSRWGIAALDCLNGMFAFCWIQKKKQQFLMARDRMGIKPLYYRCKGKGIAFASELKSIARLSAEQIPLNPHSVKMYMWMQFIPTPHSILEGCYKLPPGHYIAGKTDELVRPQPTAFWDAYAAVSSFQTPARPEGLESVLKDSLSRQLIADVPLGLFLSSGVDSSLLAALVNKHFSAGQDFNFFTVAFSEQTQSDESKDAAEFIRAFNNPALKSHTLTIDEKFIGKELSGLYNYFDEPFGDPASVLNWMISKKARQYVTVAISGDGADELFWGYPRYDQWQKFILKLPKGILLKGKFAELARSFLPIQYFRDLASLVTEKDPIKRHFNLFLAPGLKELKNEPVWDKEIWAMGGIEALNKRKDLAAVLDWKTYLADAMLYKVDRASMAASLEVRVPYLDNTVIDYALALPFEFKSDAEFRHKAVLKNLLKNLAPQYEVHRPKKGFNFPLDKWLRFSWKEMVLDIVTKDQLRKLGLDDQFYLQVVNDYYNGIKRNCIIVWYLYNLVLWRINFEQISRLKVV